MTLRKALSTMLLVSAICLAVTACGSSAGNQAESTNPQNQAESTNPQNQAESTNLQADIVGTWTCGGMTVTFASDGKTSYSGTSQSGQQIQGTSDGTAFADSTHIIGYWELDYPLYEVHIRGDSMELTGTDGSTIVYTRQ